MKDGVIFLLCAIALAHGVELQLSARKCNCDPSEAQQICRETIGTENVLIAHENCDKFYKCANGRPVAFTCPNNLLYDPVAETCNWPAYVDCGDRPISDGTDPDDPDCDGDTGDSDNENNDNDNNDGTCNCNPGEAPSICAAEGSNGVLVAHENCNQFYMCAEGKPVAITCPPTLLYNPYRRECDWPQNIDCGDRVIPEPDDNPGSDNDNGGTDNDGNDNGTCNCNPEEAPSICAAPDSEGVLVAHENCNQFYMCNFGRPVVLTCPENLLYNPYTKRCDWPSNVECGDRVVPEPESDCSICDASNESDDIDGLPLPDDDGGNDSNENDDIDDLPLPDDDGGNDSNENDDIDDLPLPDDDGGNDNEGGGDGNEGGGNDNGDGGNDNGDGGNDNDGDDNGTCNCNPEEAPALCTADNSSGVLIAHENCNQFYICDHGKPVVLSCPGNLLYNPYTEQCDWPENVDCGDRNIPETDDTDNGNDNDGSEEIPPGGDDNDNGNDNDGSEEIPPGGDDPGNDNDDNASVEIPPGGDDPGNDNDGDENNSDCDDDDNNDSGSCNCRPEDAPSICRNIGSNGILIAHENCNQFYQCSNGQPIAQRCPAGLLYDPVAEICDWPFNVECGDRVIPEPDNEDNDNDSKEEEDSDNGNDNGTCNCNPEEAPAICAVAGSEGVLIAHENCNQFYKCSYGSPIAFLCPPSLLYNPYTEQCDWPQNVECGNRVIPEPDDDNNDDNNGNDNGPIYDDPSQAPTICADSGFNGVLVAHENCNKFYLCSGGSPVAIACSAGLLFNPVIQRCDWPFNVDCGDRIVPDGNDNDCACNPRNAPSLCSEPLFNGQLIAHENCNQYYVCHGGVPVPYFCGGNTLFNIDKAVCDWPQEVNCNSRMLTFSSLNKHSESRQSLKK